jgi:hypothetical protein
MKTNYLLLVIAALLFSSCATTANYERILSSWVGAPADKLVVRWGPPQNSFPLSDGGRVLEYITQRTVQLGGYTTSVPQTTYHSGTASAWGTGGSAYGSYSGTSTTYVQQQTPTYNVPFTCMTRFVVNGQGTITDWAWQGNNCRARSPD